MHRPYALHRNTLTRAAVLAIALLTAPCLLAEPRERWPGDDGLPDRQGGVEDGSTPDLLADLLPGNCNRAKFGAIAGAALGGVLGSRIGDGDGNTAAAVAGTLIGAYIGNRIGQSLDDGDERCTGAPPLEEPVISATGERAA